MLAVKSGNYFFVYAGSKTYVVSGTLASYFPFPENGELIDADSEGGELLLPAVERARRIGILLGVKEIVLPSGKRFQVGTAGKVFPADLDFFIELLPTFAEKIRRRTKSDSLSQEQTFPTPSSW